MAPDTPEPEAPRPGTPRSEGDSPRPPRILVEVGDLEDPAEWDVILVENQEIDDETARRIAAQRAGRAQPPTKPRLGPRLPAGPSVSLPSLDERDVIQAFETDHEAEDATEIDVDAFARPDDGTPVRPRQVAELPPEHDAFADHPEPGDEPDEPEPVAEEPEPEPEPEAEEPEAEEPAEPWAPAVREGPVLLDDPDDQFYAIGDAEVAVDAPPVDDDAPPTEEEVAFAPEPSDDEGAADDDTEADAEDAETDAELEDDEPAEPSDWDLSAVALDEERELLDDPDDDFYALGRNRIAAFRPVPGAPVVPLLPAPTARLSSDLWGTGGPPPTPPEEEEVFEEEVEVDSSFPLGPDDLVIGGEVEPIALDELDYANVFGPVEGDLSIPDLDAPPTERRRRRAKPTYEDELYVFEDDDRHWPVPEPRGGRRRELVALGLAAGIIVALGVGSQVFTQPDRQENTGEQSTTSTTRARVRTSDTTAPDLTLPTLPADEPAVVGGVTVTTRPRTTTTTVKGKPAPPTTAAPTTTQAPTTTEAPTTTQAPTTTEAPTTTTLPDEGP
jgi:hypothetical protein